MALRSAGAGDQPLRFALGGHVKPGRFCLPNACSPGGLHAGGGDCGAAQSDRRCFDCHAALEGARQDNCGGF